MLLRKHEAEIEYHEKMLERFLDEAEPDFLAIEDLISDIKQLNNGSYQSYEFSDEIKERIMDML